MSSSIEGSSILADDPILSIQPAEEEGQSVEEDISNASMSIIDEDEEDENEPPLLQPVASRLISCMRAPCLKRTAETTSSSGSQTPSSGGTISPESTSPSMKNVTLPTISSSFAAIKQMSCVRPKRQVHFAIAPPESGTTYSREKYDRRPIECTRAGSLLDLSLPSRGTCPNYSGEADDEACTEDEADDDESTRDNKERMRGFARWAKLKNGGTILGGATLKYTSRSTETTRSEEESEANTCRVPAHGIRSFGGLAGSIGRSGEVHSMEEDVISKPEISQSVEENHVETLSSEDQGESDTENAAFRQAVYAALSMSPNATPMPSPSVRTRWECVTSYFDQKVAALEHVEHGVQTPDVMEEDKRIGQEDDSKFEENRTPRANASTLDDDCLSIPASFSLTTTSSSPSMDIVTNVSSSPMSSRCSSTDTWSSHGLAEREMGMNAFEEDILKGMTSFGVTTKGIDQSLREESNDQSEEARNEASSPCETSDSLETDHGTLSSTSMGCTSTQGWMSSCATSPEIGPSDGARSPIHTSLNALDAAVEQIKGKEDSKDLGEKVNTAAKLNGNLCPMDAFSKFPAFLSVHQRRAISQSAPVSSSNSPCVLSADEGEENKTSLEHKSHLSLQRSSSHSRKSRKPKRTSSQHDSPADSDDANVGRANLSGDLISPPRPRRISAQRSKSMSAAQTATVKKSSFSACSFRSEIEDEGALGGF